MKKKEKNKTKKTLKEHIRKMNENLKKYEVTEYEIRKLFEKK